MWIQLLFISRIFLEEPWEMNTPTPGAGKNHHPKSLIPQKTKTVFDDSFEDLVMQSQEKCLFEKEV